MTHYTQVTVFGGTGFLGRYVIDRLADLGVTVRVATRSPANAYFLRTAGTVGQVVPVLCNIHEDNSVFNAIQGSDWVINLVGILAEKGKHNNFENLHHTFPARLSAMAARCNVKNLVHVSALGASGQSPSAYARSKAMGETAVLLNFPRASILRPSIMYGKEDRFFNFFARMASLSPFLPLIGGGVTKFQPVYVGDVADAILKCLTQENAVGRIYELTGTDIYSFRDLLEKMMRITGVQKPFLKIPFGLAKVQGAVFQRLPGALLTVDQVKQLQSDNVFSHDKPGLHQLGITPETLDAILPTYLKRFQPGGRFAGTRHIGQRAA